MFLAKQCGAVGDGLVAGVGEERDLVPGGVSSSDIGSQLTRSQSRPWTSTTSGRAVSSVWGNSSP